MQSVDPVALDAADPLKRFRDEFHLPVFDLVGEKALEEQRAWCA
jgi:hypothetical protein